MLDVERYLGPLPPPEYARIGEVVSRALPSIRPPRRIDVPKWAENERQLRTPTYSGPWRNDFAPYMVEPSRMMTSRKYGAVIFVGPARTVKTDALVLNTFGHRVTCMPRDMLIVAPTKDAAREFSITKLDPMIRATRSVSGRMVSGRGADNIFDKKVAGNMRVRIGWPVIGQLSMVDIPDVLLTDYDRMPDDVDGEGAPFDLARKRTQTFGSLGMVVCESSPGRPISDEDWKASSPHEAPPVTGVLALFNSGTRGKFYWQCPQCHEPFEPLFDRLQWETLGSHGESAKTVCMVCPHGHSIAPSQKQDLNAQGFWLHETSDGTIAEIASGHVRETDVVSYWCEGPVAAMQSWDQLVLRHLDAKAEFERTGDETRWKATVNLDQGRPYQPRVRSIGEGLSEDTLKAMSRRFPMKIAPAGTRFVTVQVDVQATRFVVQADAWMEGLERYLIDRFDIVKPPISSPGFTEAEHGRAIDPGRYGEDWRALDELLEMNWPVADSDFRILPRAMIVDMRGAPGVTSNAIAFWRRKVREGLGHRVFLANNAGGVDRERAVYTAPEKVLGDKKKRRTDLRLVRVGTDPLKDEVALSLTRKEDGPGAYHLSEHLPEQVFAEFCAEIRTPKGWQVRRHGLRNEAFDLAVYGKALSIVLKAEKIDWSAAPDWARPIAENSYAVQTTSRASGKTPVVAPVHPAKSRGRRVRSRGL